MRELTVVVGGQYGSEGKGAVVGHLARSLTRNDVVIRVGGPNAGHTVVDSQNRTWKLRQIPAAAPVSDCQLAIGAGSEIDLTVLFDELAQFDKAEIDLSGRLTIHPAATILTTDHQIREYDMAMTRRIGSTGKGIGAARGDRIMRTALTADQYRDSSGFALPHIGSYRDSFASHPHVLIEGTQGYGLGLHTEQYPFATSGDCTAIDFLAQAQIMPWSTDLDRMTVWVVARANPIRVAGNSGPLFGETSWAALGLPEERTTVTNKIRRVGTWDARLVREAVAANGGHPVVRLALTMLDHRFPKIAGITTEQELNEHFDVMQWIERVEEECNALVGLVGTGPSTMVEIRED